MWRGLLLSAAVFTALPAWADLPGPAELPPPDYAGQQYVDSKGCLFVRAGVDVGREVWIPRVTREGKPLCDKPPSGNRVPVIEEGSARPAATGKNAREVQAAAGVPGRPFRAGEAASHLLRERGFAGFAGNPART